MSVQELSSITIYKMEDSNYYVITEHETGVTTQGETKIEALLMLADALSAYTNSDIDLLEKSKEIFTMNEEELEDFITVMEDSSQDKVEIPEYVIPTDIDEELEGRLDDVREEE